MSRTNLTTVKAIRFSVDFWEKIEQLSEIYNIPMGTLLRIKTEEKLTHSLDKEIEKQLAKRRKIS